MVKSKLILIAFILLGSTISISWKLFKDDNKSLKAKIDNYLKSEEPEPSKELVAELRTGNYETVDWLYKTYWTSALNYDTYRSNKKFLKLFDNVCGQKDAISSKLFWYSNPEEALAAAKKENKPLLCLQMLGNLREDFSCANSRFFRTLLYSNPKISKVLRDKYILCWESVIEVPKVTIEYPDGKKQIQTITGNSMHLILNPDGEILDALPGLYGPAFFETWLNQYASKNSLKIIRENQLKRIKELKSTELQSQLKSEEWSNLVQEEKMQNTEAPVKALKASEISVAKVATEVPLYTKVLKTDKKYLKSPSMANPNAFAFYEPYGFKNETVIQQTIELIKSKKKYTSEELNKTIKTTSDNLSKESIRNDVNLHVTILEWLQNETMSKNKKQFVSKVYRDLFLTPLDDKRMGLYDKSIYTATTDDGFIEE